MLNRLIEAALVVVLPAAVAGQPPLHVQTVRVAQLQLINKDSQSSKWGRAMLLPVKMQARKHASR